MSAPYLTTGQAAAALGVGLSTLQRWAHAGDVTPAFRTVGGHFRWDVADLREQLAAMQGEGLAEDAAAVPEPQPVVAAVATSSLGVLLGRRNDGRPPWTFPAGEIEPGESPADAARREVKEETGLLVRPGRVLGRRIHPATGRTMIYVTAAPTHGTDVFVGDPAELAEVRWASLAEALELLPGMFGPVQAYLARELRGAARKAS